jgi:hypothetical protein
VAAARRAADALREELADARVVAAAAADASDARSVARMEAVARATVEEAAAREAAAAEREAALWLRGEVFRLGLGSPPAPTRKRSGTGTGGSPPPIGGMRFPGGAEGDAVRRAGDGSSPIEEGAW